MACALKAAAIRKTVSASLLSDLDNLRMVVAFYMRKNTGNMHGLSQSTIEKLGYYVYLLIDPRDHKPFYVGKGQGNRVNQHLFGALETELDEVDKIKTIHDIKRANLEVGHLILRHGLTEKEAFEVESAVIDLIGINNLTNMVAGHYASERGLMSLQDIAIKYQAEDAEFDESVLLININKLYHHDISPEDLYEATRKYWKVSRDRIVSIKLVCAVYIGIIREVYVPIAWFEAAPDDPIGEGRLYFEGRVAPTELRDKYIYKSVSKYWKRGSQNPIKYVSP